MRKFINVNSQPRERPTCRPRVYGGVERQIGDDDVSAYKCEDGGPGVGTVLRRRRVQKEIQIGDTERPVQRFDDSPVHSIATQPTHKTQYGYLPCLVCSRAQLHGRARSRDSLVERTLEILGVIRAGRQHRDYRAVLHDEGGVARSRRSRGAELEGYSQAGEECQENDSKIFEHYRFPFLTRSQPMPRPWRRMPKVSMKRA